MIDYYNAFISYRHAPLDSSVAEHVQKSLEHFRIPTAIRKKTGKKKIERIFRDKDELPITSDLTDTISSALEKADYLIVICSPNTKESHWVTREIKYFLRNHRKDHVLTVLADGDPNDVVPEELKYDERTVTEYNGETHTIKAPIEPLSCDYRMKFSKAKKEEIPRLAAALIGCSYDELVRRQRQYRFRRFIAVTAVLLAAAIGFGLYMAHSKKQIDEAYMESLANQSRYLASEANALLEDERRIDALYLALAAVPQGPDDPRPVTGEAVAALTEASLAYVGLSGNNIDAVWNYSLATSIKDFVISPSGTRLAAIDSLGTIHVWDTETHEELFTVLDPDYQMSEMVFADDEVLLVINYGVVKGYSALNGELLWESDDSDYTLVRDIMFPGDGLIIYANNGPQFFVCDSHSGRVFDIYDLTSQLGSHLCTMSHAVLSPDGSMIGFVMYEGLNSNFVGTYDIRSGRVLLSDQIEESVSAIEWADDEHLAVSFYDIYNAGSSQMADTYLLRPNYSVVRCYDPDTLNVVWTQEHVSSCVNVNTEFFPLPPNNLIAYCTGNVVSAYDIDSGELMYEWSANQPVIDISDRDDNGWPIMITQDGALLNPVPSQGNDVVAMLYEFPNDITDLVVNHGVYVLQDCSSDIVYYNTYIRDEQWEETPNVDIDSISNFYLDDNILAIYSFDIDNIELTLINPETNKVIETIELDETEASYEFVFLGVYNGNLYGLSANADEAFLYEIDIATGEYKTEFLCNSITISSASASLVGHYIVFQDPETFDLNIGLMDLDTGRTETFSTSLGAPYNDAGPYYSEQMGLIYIPSYDGDHIIEIDEDDCFHVVLPEDWNGTMFLECDDSLGRFFVSDGHTIGVVDAGGNYSPFIDTEGRRPLGFTVIRHDGYGINENGELLVVYSDGFLYRYNALTGELIDKSEISTYLNYTPTAEFTVDYDAGFLYIQQYQLTNAIDLNSWVELACIQNSFGHYAPLDRFYTFSYEVSSHHSIGYFRHYTLDELIDMANNLLGGVPMPDSLRTRYGISDDVDTGN